MSYAGRQDSLTDVKGTGRPKETNQKGMDRQANEWREGSRHTGQIVSIAKVDRHTTSYFKARVRGQRHLGSGPKVSSALQENQFEVRLKGSQVT